MGWGPVLYFVLTLPQSMGEPQVSLGLTLVVVVGRLQKVDIYLQTRDILWWSEITTLETTLV